MSAPRRWICSAKWDPPRHASRSSASRRATPLNRISSLLPTWPCNALPAEADPEMAATAISELEFEKFREFFYRKTGIQFEPSKRYFVDKRLEERIELTDSGNFRNWFMMLRFEASGEELQHLTNLMTLNATYFFRDEYQFQCLVRPILPDIVSRKKGEGPIRIWAIPSSSGEEPYS